MTKTHSNPESENHGSGSMITSTERRRIARLRPSSHVGWLIALVLAACSSGGTPSDAGPFEVVANVARLAPHGSTPIVATRSGDPVHADWAATGGVIRQDGDDGWHYVAPSDAGTYRVTATTDGTSASTEITVVQAADTTSSTVGQTGGSVALDGGADVTFEEGALLEPSDVTLERIDTSPADYGEGVVRIGDAARVRIAKAALDFEGSGVTVAVPAPRQVDGSSTSLAEVRIELLDGTSRVLLESYSPLEESLAAVTIGGKALEAIDRTDGLPEVVSILVQPLDVGGVESTALEPQDVTYLDGLYKVDLPAADFGDVTDACGSGDQTMPSWIEPSSGPAARQPVVLVAGWQVLGNLGTDLADDTGLDLLVELGTSPNPLRRIRDLERDAPVRNAAYCDWAPLIQHLADIGLDERAEVYLFGYDSGEHVGDNAADLKNALEDAFPGHEPVIVAHSMGGLVADAAVFQGLSVEHVLTLGTPYRGSRALSCNLSNPFTNRCIVAAVHPVLQLETTLAAIVAAPTRPEIAYALVGLRSTLVSRLTKYQGTRDLAWDCCALSKNDFLNHIHADLDRDYSAFTSFYGDLSERAGDAGVLGPVQEYFFELLGDTSDGIVSPASARLELDGSRRMGEARRFAGHDHLDLKGGSDRSDPPSCSASQVDEEREKACEAMRAIGNLLEDAIDTASPSEPALTSLADDFDDGDFTSDPAWNVVNNDDRPGSVGVTDGYVRWTRSGARGNGGAVGIDIEVDIPVTDATTAVFDVLATFRDVGDGCGWTCGEYPANVMLYLENDAGDELRLRYAFNYGTELQDKERDDFRQIATQVPRDEWVRDLSFNVREGWPEAARITRVHIYGNGWNFEGGVDDIAIVER